ncbi:MAG TPA: hypothetical protein EYP39_09530 [Ghiorsea sp.]|nr:hypothetical protein [Ghiorsea sp.]
MAIKSLEAQHKRKIFVHLLGEAMNYRSFFYIFLFIVFVEFVVSPAQKLFSLLIETALPFEKGSLGYFFSNFMVATLIFFLFYCYAMHLIRKTRDTIPLKLEEIDFPKTDIANKKKDVHLLLNLSTPSNHVIDIDGLKNEIADYPSLELPEFKEKWDSNPAIEKHNWRQPLLVISQYLQQGLSPYIYLICSEQSEKDVQGFLDIVDAQMKTTTLQHKIKKQDPLNFFKLEECTKGLDKIVRKIEEEYPKHAIVIDITSGTAPLSAAGVTVSFAHDRRFQYLTTIEKSAQLHHYSAEYGDSIEASGS